MDIDRLVNSHLWLVKQCVENALRRHPTADRDQLESDAMLALFRKAQKYRDGIGSFATFAEPRVKGACADALRAMGRKRTAELVYEPVAAHKADWSDWWAWALGLLTDPQRAVLGLILLGHAQVAISRAMGCSERNVSQIKGYAIDRIRKAMMA